MQSDALLIDSAKTKRTIVSFLKKTFLQQKINHVILGLSGGIDSTVTLYLLKETLPINNIFVAYMPYFNKNHQYIINIVKKIGLPDKNFVNISIKKPVGDLIKSQKIIKNDLIRIGNIMARIRMVILFDLAKKYNALVCGTENMSEHLLGYFTRFGDGASDIEPIRHLYKTQIYQLAEYLGVPKKIINQKPTAGLWKNQTDEGQFGFTYNEADHVLYLYFDKKITTDKIIKMGYPNAKKIITYVKRNEFKQKTPYVI